MIEQKGNTSGTLVTLRNYGVYQDSDEGKGNTEESPGKHSGNAQESKRRKYASAMQMLQAHANA